MTTMTPIITDESGPPRLAPFPARYVAALSFTCGDDECFGDLVPADVHVMECDACGKLYRPMADPLTWESRDLTPPQAAAT